MSITKFPPELFIKICTFLPPADLFTLSQVCRKFRGYLFAPNSLSTQQIWRESRLKFIPNETIPPPEGMSEEKYVELLMMERGCQICKHAKKCEIYWQFEIRCCEKCLKNKTIERFKLTIEMKYPLELINILPYTEYKYSKYYWIDQIYLAYNQYYGLSKENLQSWLDDKKPKFHSIMKYVAQRKPIILCPFYPDWFSSPIFPPLLNRRWCDGLYLKSRNWENRIDNNYVENIPQLIQFQIQKLEKQSTFCSQVNIKNNLHSKYSPHKHSDELKRNDFVKTKDKFNMKVKNFKKNKLVQRYG
ncbi:hypothetical protein C1645_811442 [Glomus cerebriforme]|uniref:F-box domain-containing protein n=1 Tax=Glomus cerebriforme TaxID=658196 RepID=A0A397TS01_9GLOM|nr:hypothetical protein C1645_811442 [Glomus cerebriforme]